MSGVGNSLGREAIDVAFFNQISTVLKTQYGFEFTSRRPVPPASLGQCQYPAMYYVAVGEIYDRTVLKAPARVTLLRNIVIDSNAGVDFTDGDSSATDLNNLADQVEAAIQSACDVTAQNILGGLVQQAWINHRQQTILGSVSQQFSRMTFLVEIVLPHSR